MKNKIDRMKTPAMHLSKRTVALILSVIMLVSSIATGSMLNTFAAYLKDAAANSDAVSQAADAGCDIAKSAIPSQDADAAAQADNEDKPDLSGFEENEIVRGMKDDFAYTAAKLDLAATGTTYYLWTSTDGGNYSSFSKVGEMTGDGTVSGSFTHSGNGNVYFIINTSSTSASSGDVITGGFSGITVTNSDSSLFNNAFCQQCWNGTAVFSVGFSMKNGNERTINVTYNPSTSTITYGGSSSGGGGTSPTVAPTVAPTEAPASGRTDVTPVTYYYRGGSNNWGATEMTASADGYYAYIQQTGEQQFKIATTTSGWDYNYSYVKAGFNSTNVTNIGDQGKDNCKCWQSGTYYILVYYPNSDINTSSDKPVICASTTLPDARKTGCYAYAKGSDDGSTYNTSLATIASNFSASYAKGKELAAGTRSGYEFVGWVASGSGVFTDPTANTTKFYPKANSETATAQFKRKYSVTESHTGTGTVTISKASPLAGDSYTITATPGTGYMLTSLKLNNGTELLSENKKSEYTYMATATGSTATLAYTATFAEAAYTVTKGAETNGTFTVDKTSAKSGDTVTISNITPAKGYQLSTVKYTANGTTSNATKNGDNYTFTMPAYDATVNVTFTAINYNVSTVKSPNGGGTLYVSTSSANPSSLTSTTYTIGNTLYYKATAAAAYTLSSVDIAYSDGTETQQITNVTSGTAKQVSMADHTGDVTITANFTKKPTHKVTVVSNNNALGTATASVTEAYEGQEVTLTPKEDTGSFSSWSVTSGNVTVNNNNKFTMGSSDVAITANFVAYSGTSNFYYNSYGSNGQPASSRYGAQMQKAKIGGVEYSYYHVSGRTESDQLFTVSYGTPKNNSWDCFFEVESSWGSTTPKALFYATDEKNLGDWADMNYIEEKNSKKRYRIAIPDGARSVRFKHGSDESNELYFSTGYNGWYTNSSMKSVTAYKQSPPVPENFWENFNSSKYTNAFESKGFDNHNADRGQSHSYTKPKDLGAYSGDYYILVLEKGKTYTINGVTKTITNDPEIIWLPELPDSGDTIKVYAKDGAIRSDLKTYGNMADTTVLKADGTTSAGATSYGSDGQTYEVYKAQPGETIVIQTTIGNTACAGSTETYRDRFYVRGFSINGEVPQLLEPIDTGVYTQRYTVPEDYEGKYIEITPIYFLKDTTNNPVVTFRATNFPKGQYNWGNVPYCYPFYGNLSDKDNAFGAYPGQPLIFYKGQYSMQVPVKSTSPFSATGASTNVAGITMSNGYYDSVHKLIMGYGDDSTSADHVQTYDYGDFWKIFNEKKPVDNIVFDFKYKKTKHNLIDDTTGDSIATSTLTDKYTNGFELLKNFHGRNVDLFGKALSGNAADPNKTPAVYVVSIGGINDNVSGVENIAGYYATEWRVYAPNDKTSVSTTYKRMTSGGKSSIPPEVLVLNDDDDTSFNNTTYPSAVDKPQKSYKVTDWKSLYQALENYRDLPVYISYEAADAQNGAEDYHTGTHGATRNDGRWLYSKNGESITSNIRVDVSQDNGEHYYPNGDSHLSYDAGESSISGLSAYFTNAAVYGEQTYATTIDPDKTYDFEAKTTNANYMFVGWYLDDDNNTLITTDNESHTERSGSYTFVARFKRVTSGQLILSHSVDTGTIGGTNYDGAGTVTIGAVVKDGGGNTKKTYAPSTSDITIGSAYIKSDNTDYTIDVTLTATRGNNSALGTTILATPDGQESKFFDYGDFTLSADGKTRTYTFTVNVRDLYTGDTQDYMNLIYHSYFKNYVFNYTVNYEFKDRFGNDKIYNRAGTLTAPEAETYVYKATDTNTGKDNRYLKKEFFESLAPYESNFQQDIKWNLSDSVFTEGTNYVYTCNTHIGSTPVDENKKVDVTFVLPYEHTNGVATLNSEGVGTAATATNYAMIKESDSVDNRVKFGDIPVLTGNRTNGIYTEEEKSHWIAAPLKLDNDKFFSHWSVKTTDTKTEVARCYFPGFNFLAYDNYEITAVYGTAPVDMSATGVSTAVTYLDTTRNQWNALTSSDAAVPTVQASDKVNAGDILYNDFVLSYSYNGVEIHQGGSATNDITELGIVVERIKELDKNSDNTYDTRISSYTNLPQDTTKITNAAKTAGDASTGQATIKDSGKQYYKQSINKTALDNKDRIVFFEAFSNTAGWNSEKQRPVGNYSYKKYVYRAYTYITYNDGSSTRTVLSETPAYFIMYDIATADYSAD